MRQSLTRLASLTPITLRGFVLLLFLSFLYLKFVTDHNDIIATVLVVTLFLTFLLALLIALLAGSRLRNVASLSMFPSTKGRLHSSEVVQVLLRLSALRIPPLFNLTVQPRFANYEEPFVQATFAGYASVERTVTTEITFPHRGHWSVSSVRWILSDCFGLTMFQWYTDPPEHAEAVTVLPPDIHTDAIPFIASSYREGDAIPHPMDHSGDYYDIKRYHPSDGMNKLLWKLFARSGDLLARKPEESVSPEGLLVGFCFARRSDDALAVLFHNYVKRAFEADMSIISSCLGAKEQALARTPDQLFALLIDSALQVPANTKPLQIARIELQLFLSKVKKELGVSSLANVLICVSESCLSTPEEASLAAELGTIVTVEEAKPIFCILPDNSATTRVASPAVSPAVSKILSLCVERDSQGVPTSSHRSHFVNACEQNGWQILYGGAR